MYSSDLVDQQISIAKNNEGKIQFDSIIFGNGDYVQVLQCNVNFKDSGSNPDNPEPVDPDNPDNNYDEQIKQLQDEIDELKNAIQEIKNTDISQNENIETLQQQYDELKQSIENLQTQISNLKQQFEDNKEDVNEKFKLFNEALKLISNKIKDLQEQINNINVNPDNPEDNTGSSLKSGQLSVQTNYPKTQNLQADQVGELAGEQKQYVFKFDSECTPQNIVDSLEANDEFMNIFLPVWDQTTNQFIIFAKNTIPDQSVVIFNASGTVANMLGLYETKYLKINHSSNNSKIIYNRFINFPKITQTIKLSFISTDDQIPQKIIDFTDIYSHNEIRKRLADSFTLIEIQGQVLYQYGFDIIPYKDDPNKFIIVFLIQNVVQTGQFGTSLGINITTDAMEELNLLKIRSVHEILNFNENQNQMIQISEPFDLTDEQTPFKPECNLYINSDIQNMLEMVCQNYEYRESAVNHNYYNNCRIMLYNLATGQTCIYDGISPDVSYKDNFASSWNKSQIGQYFTCEQDSNENMYLKFVFKPTDLYNSSQILWGNQEHYYYWFDQYNVISNHSVKKENDQTIDYLQMNNYPAFYTGQVFEIHFGSQSLFNDSNQEKSLNFDFVMRDQLDKLKEKRVTKQNYTDNYSSNSNWYLNHNDFRNIWCTFQALSDFYNNQSYIAYLEMNYDYTKDQWYLEITIPPDNNDHLWSLWFNSNNNNSSNYIGHVMKLTAEDDSLNNSHLWNAQDPIVLKDPGTYRFYTPETVYKQDTINIDTEQPVNFNDTEQQLKQWNEHNTSTQNTTVKFKDLINKTEHQFDMSKDCSFYEIINEWNNADIGKYFLADKLNNESQLTVYFELKLEELLNTPKNIYGQGILIKWENGDQSSTWFNNGNLKYQGHGEFLLPDQDINDEFYQNVIDFDPTNYWNESLKQAYLGLTKSNKLLQKLQRKMTTSVKSSNYQVSSVKTTQEDFKYLKLYCDDLKATYRDLNNNFSKNGLVAVITENDYQPTTTKLYKIQGNAQPITFYLKDQDDKPYTNEVVLQVQFYKNSVIKQ